MELMEREGMDRKTIAPLDFRFPAKFEGVSWMK